jgi:predicted Rdx family selenoprotein
MPPPTRFRTTTTSWRHSRRSQLNPFTEGDLWRAVIRWVSMATAPQPGRDAETTLRPMAVRHRVRIEYCVPRGALPNATGLAARVLEEWEQAIEAVEVVPGTFGCASALTMSDANVWRRSWNVISGSPAASLHCLNFLANSE